MVECEEMILTHISLFTGIGGFDIAAEWAGFKTIAQVEKDQYCNKILKEHWPKIYRCEDIKNFPNKTYKSIDVISGGFPCQDISIANQFGKQGIEGKRSGLWKEYKRCICEIRPRYAIMENVPAILNNGLGVVLGDLADIGYDAEWDCLSAWQFGAPQTRVRTFIVAYPMCERLDKTSIFSRASNICKNEKKKEWTPFMHNEQYLSDKIFGYRLPPYPENIRMVNEPSIGLDEIKERIKCCGNAVNPRQVYGLFKAIANELSN